MFNQSGRSRKRMFLEDVQTRLDYFTWISLYFCLRAWQVGFCWLLTVKVGGLNTRQLSTSANDFNRRSISFDTLMLPLKAERKRDRHTFQVRKNIFRYFFWTWHGLLSLRPLQLQMTLTTRMHFYATNNAKISQKNVQLIPTNFRKLLNWKCFLVCSRDGIHLNGITILSVQGKSHPTTTLVLRLNVEWTY